MASKIADDINYRNEVYFTYEDFERLRRNHDRGFYKRDKDPYGLLLCAKAYFIKEKYAECI